MYSVNGLYKVTTMKNGKAKRERDRQFAKSLHDGNKICPNCLGRQGGAGGHWSSLDSIPGSGIGASLFPNLSASEVFRYCGFYQCGELYDPLTRRRRNPGTCGFINDIPKDYEQVNKAA
jgi:hypothetical protein